MWVLYKFGESHVNFNQLNQRECVEKCVLERVSLTFFFIYSILFIKCFIFYNIFLKKINLYLKLFFFLSSLVNIN